MTPEQIKRARQKLRLSQAELGRLLDTDAQTIRRMEMDPDASTARQPAVRMERLLTAYLSGYRPADWPDSDIDPGDHAGTIKAANSPAP